MRKMFFTCAVQYGNHMWLLTTTNIMNVATKLIFLNVDLILIKVNAIIYTWLLAAILNSIALDFHKHYHIS